MDKSKGYVIFWRSILDTHIWSNPKLFRLYAWCIMRASYESRIVFPTTQKLELQAGQFVMSYPHARLDLKMSVGTLKRYIGLLSAESIIESKSTNKYTVITIQNWIELQKPERKNESKLKTFGKQMETINTLKTLKYIKDTKVSPFMGNYSYPYKEVNELKEYFLKVMVLPEEDGNLKANKANWKRLLEKSSTGTRGVKDLIDKAKISDFFSKTISNSTKLWTNRVAILQASRSRQPKIAVMPSNYE